MLGIRLPTICSRHPYEQNAAPVIAELVEVAGNPGDILTFEAGRWAGYYDEAHNAALVTATIAEVPGAAGWTHVGRARRAAPAHRTTGFGPA